MSIQCDKNWTVEALQNIIKNCVEHMDDGGSLSVKAELKKDPRRKYATRAFLYIELRFLL